MAVARASGDARSLFLSDPRRSLGSACDREQRHADRRTEAALEPQPWHQPVVEARLDAGNGRALQHVRVQVPARHAEHVEIAHVLDCEPRPLELTHQAVARVPPMVVNGAVDGAVEALKRRDDQHDATTWHQHVAHPGERRAVLLDVLEYVGADNGVEGASRDTVLGQVGHSELAHFYVRAVGEAPLQELDVLAEDRQAARGKHRSADSSRHLPSQLVCDHLAQYRALIDDGLDHLSERLS